MTFLDNIRAIHNFYCINTNNLIEYSIFVENAQTMKKTFIFILWSLFSVAVNAQNFNDYFEDKTLRVDYIFTGNATKQEIYSAQIHTCCRWHAHNPTAFLLCHLPERKTFPDEIPLVSSFSFLSEIKYWKKESFPALCR